MQDLKQKYNIIVAIGANYEIGDGEDLLWHLPADMKFFKETTKGADVIMGRKTYESIPKKFRPLPGRTNIVITRNKNYVAEDGVYISNTLKDAFEIAENCSTTNKFIIGGGSIYESTLNYAHTLYVTHVHKVFKNANTFFPIIDASVWKETSREDFKADEKNKFEYSFVKYEKI
ncbi:MAG: dihydrofolate reductase [Chitinophagales bacterium]